MLSYYNTTAEIAASGVDTAVLPIGSIEQHGSHLPLGTDHLIASAVAEKIAQEIGAYLLPCLPISNCYEHTGTRGTVWMSPRTLYDMVEDIVLSLKESGFSKVFIILGHGGVFALYPCVRELNKKIGGLQVAVFEPLLTPEQKKQILETPNELHSGEAETSMMMYLHPDAVKVEEAKKNDFIPDAAQSELNLVPLKLLSPNGVWGCPSRATPQKGEQIFALCVENGVEFFKKAFAKMPKDAWIDVVPKQK